MDEATPEMRKLLGPGESFVWVARPDAKVWLRIRAIELWFVVVALLLIAFLLRLAPLSSPQLRLAWALTGGGVLLVVIVAFLERGWYRHQVYGLTSIRLFLQTGALGSQVTTVNLTRVDGCAVNRNSWDRLFKRGTGTLEIRTHSDAAIKGGWSPTYHLVHVGEPETVRDKISKLSQADKEKHSASK